MIDFDLFMEKYLDCQKVVNDEYKNQLAILFQTLDQNGDKMCDLYEFMTLITYVEGIVSKQQA